MSPGVRPTPGNRPNRFSDMVQLFLGQMGSDFERILYMCNIFLCQVGKDPWELLLENISISRMRILISEKKNTTQLGRDSRTGQTGATCAIREWV